MIYRSVINCRLLQSISLFSALFGTAFLASPCRGGLTHYYPFSLDASDTIGSAHGTLVDGASVNGGLLLLDGGNDYVQFGQKIVPTSGSYSVTMFARQTTPQNYYAELISQGFSGPGFYIGHDYNGTIRVGDSWLNTGVPFPSDGEFHHIAVTVDAVAGESKLYIDGSLSATLASAISSTAGGTHTRFGNQFDFHTEFFGGTLDEVRIYDHSLTAGEIATLAVPEPATATLALLVVGFASLASRRR